jgi:3-oxocholest-4-en-26-oyl-CoA dehydrogenase beta subunit
MDFSFSDEQEAVRTLSAQIFDGLATVERIKDTERSTDRFDRTLWSELAKANLLGIAVPEEWGGSGLGIIELCLLLEQQGRRVAPVPLLPTLAMGALPIAEFGTPEQRRSWLPGVVSGETVLTAALSEGGANDPLRPSTVATALPGGRWQLSGTKPSVPAVHLASRVLVPARTDGGSVVLLLVDPAHPGVRIEPATTTSRELQGHLSFDGVELDPDAVLGSPDDGAAILRWLVDRVMVGLCAIQVGVAEEAVRQAAAYTSGRVQFGKPLSTFQGVALKAADAYIDTEAMRATLWQAAWRLSEGRDATADVEVAKWWAAEGGQRVVHITQHLHGGIGADVEYPIHRYFLWGKQLEVTLGGASAQLSRLGTRIADAARRGERIGAFR